MVQIYEVKTRWLSTSNRSRSRLLRPARDSSGAGGHQHFLVYLTTSGDAESASCLQIYDRAPGAQWMSGLSDSLQLSSLFLAGTHDSAARFGWPFASCQSLFATLRRQLEDGVRFLDLRFALREGSVLVCCHGPLVQLLTARGALLAIYEFLERNPRETVIVSIKQEAGGPDERIRFAESVMRLVEMDRGMWYTEAQRIPRLGEVRGRCILFSRFGESEKPLGLHPTNWPYNSLFPFTWQCGDTLVAMQDWNEVPSISAIPAKFSHILDLFYLPLPPPPARVWRINFTSGASFGTALPCVVAKGAWWAWFGGAEGINSRLARFLLGCHTPPAGHVCVLDYYDSEAGLVELMIALNYRALPRG